MQQAPAPVYGPELVIVTAVEGDTLASLAQTYLGNARKAWRIADYNRIDHVKPEQRLIIPLKPVIYGGLRPDGYQTVPVLYYPTISIGSMVAGSVSAAAFEKQMQFLAQSGYASISLEQLAQFLSFQDTVPPKALMVTFDTTQRWVLDIAYPILKANGLTAAVFVTPEQIGTKGHLNWQELAKLAAGGFDIGAAGHIQTSSAPGENGDAFEKPLEDELSIARRDIEAHLQRPCGFYTYAGGKASDSAIALLKKHGYQGAFTQQEGLNPFFTDNFHLYRSLIDDKTDLKHFQQKLQFFTAAELP